MMNQPVLEMKQVSLWRGDAVLLDQVNWRVNPGENWAILGLNGSGKTMLLSLINGYCFPSKGEMTVLGRSFGQTDLRELRKKIGWVSSALQERLYGQETAAEIVASGKHGAIGLPFALSRSEYRNACLWLEQLHCSALADRYYHSLSQGEKQNILLARALVAAPSLLVLDEPCTGLDLFARERFFASIERIADLPEAPEILYVTHRVEEILPVFSHTLLVKEGRIFHAGQTGDLLTDSVLSRFLEVPATVACSGGRYRIHLCAEQGGGQNAIDDSG